jgi:hypothetical protein
MHVDYRHTQNQFKLFKRNTAPATAVVISALHSFTGEDFTHDHPKSKQKARIKCMKQLTTNDQFHARTSELLN